MTPNEHSIRTVTETGRVNLFFIFSPLHYLASERIVDYFEQDARNVLYYLKQQYGKIVNEVYWDTTRFLPWPRFYPLPGLFGASRRILDNLAIIGRDCAGASSVTLHTTVIDTEAVNYAINFLRRELPGADIRVRVIPDGLMNVQRHPLPPLRRLALRFRKTRKLFSPQLDYYIFSGDRTGADDPITDRIYLLPRFPHQYDPAKVVTIPSLVNPTAPLDRQAGAEAGPVLVLGQPLLAFKRMSEPDMAAITEGIRTFIGDTGNGYIFYKAHPRDQHHDFCHSDYKNLVIDEPLESHLARNPYRLVIGIDSTALLTARLILPATSRVVSYGLNRMLFRSEADRNSIYLPFRQLGVELVDCPE